MSDSTEWLVFGVLTIACFCWTLIHILHAIERVEAERELKEIDCRFRENLKRLGRDFKEIREDEDSI